MRQLDVIKKFDNYLSLGGGNVEGDLTVKNNTLATDAEVTDLIHNVETTVSQHAQNTDNPHKVALTSFGVTVSATDLNHVDGVTSNIQTQLNGKAASSHGTHVTYTTTTPKANGTAAAGTVATVSRSDHVHPLQTTVSGNAGTATKLLTAKTISLTGSVTGSGSFDGSSDISINTTTNHTHSYAGSASVGGAATSANKLNTDAGSVTQPVYFSGGVPVKTTYTLGKSVPSDAKFTDTTYSAATTSANGLMSSTDKKKVDSISGTYALGNFASKTVADLQAALDTWLDSYVSIANASTTFQASPDWVAAWNSGNTATTIIAGGTWTVTNIAPYSTKAYAQLRISQYIDEQIVYVCRSNGVWGIAHQAAFKDDLNSKQNTITGAASTIADSNLTASRALISNSSGKVTVSDVTSTELSYLDGVTSDIQTQFSNIQTQVDERVKYKRFGMTDSYMWQAIPLICLDNTNTQADAEFIGEVAFKRKNGNNYLQLKADITCIKAYNSTNPVFSLRYDGNANAANRIFPVKFTLNALPYFGLLIRNTSAGYSRGYAKGFATNLDIVQSIDVYNNSTNAIINAEIYNSIEYLDTDTSQSTYFTQSPYIMRSDSTGTRYSHKLLDERDAAEIWTQLDGKADSSHDHAASDITSGTLGVARGGTGATTFTSGSVLVGNGTSAITTRAIATSVTSGSTSLVTSDAVYTAIQNSFANGDYLAKDNPTGTGSLSINRYPNSTVGVNSVALGQNSYATANYSTGIGFTVQASADFALAANYYTYASNEASIAFGHRNKSMTAGGTVTNTVGDAMVIGNGGVTSASASNAFRVTFSGAVYGKSAFNSTGADYAEFFEWSDGNLDNEDRIGYFVTLDGNKIRVAEPDDYLLGIISGQPCIVGNSDEDWLGRWEHDEFGRFIKEPAPKVITQEVEVPVLDADGSETGETAIEIQHIEVEGEYDGWRYKANLDYDPEQEYIERKDRPEWDYVGMLGVLAVRQDSTCKLNEFCKVGIGGVATYADTHIPGQTYRVIDVVSENVVKVVFR